MTLAKLLSRLSRYGVVGFASAGVHYGVLLGLAGGAGLWLSRDVSPEQVADTSTPEAPALTEEPAG